MAKKHTSKVITKKRILVTGGTGSFGKMFIKEILKFSPKKIVVFSRDENKQGEMRREYNDKRIEYILGDVRDIRSLREAMRGIDIVIHAAALKWITEVEYNVWEGVKTNIIGTQNLIHAAKDAHVEKVVALSTDKAVEPINAYGMAKALQERLITAANLYENGSKTVFISTRYGNVLGSRGSVVPHFRSLLDKNKPVTITDSQMTRFMMTLQESVQLVLTALEKGVGGEVFVRKMPGHTITDLAEVMMEAYSKNKGMKTVGIRPGEKIHESLLSMSESVRTIEFGDYYIVLPQITIPILEKKYKKYKRLKPFVYTSDTTKRMTKKQIASVLKREGWI